MKSVPYHLPFSLVPLEYKYRSFPSSPSLPHLHVLETPLPTTCETFSQKKSLSRSLSSLPPPSPLLFYFPSIMSDTNWCPFSDKSNYPVCILTAHPPPPPPQITFVNTCSNSSFI